MPSAITIRKLWEQNVCVCGGVYYSKVLESTWHTEDLTVRSRRGVFRGGWGWAEEPTWGSAFIGVQSGDPGLCGLIPH